MSKTIQILIALFCCCIFSPLRSDANPVHIVAFPCFKNMVSDGVYPIIVNLQNSGPAVKGLLKIQAETYNNDNGRVYSYPVTLAADGSDQFIAYPMTQDYYESLDVDFISDGTTVREKVDTSSDNGGYDFEQAVRVGMVGDEFNTVGVKSQSDNDANEDNDDLDFGSGDSDTFVTTYSVQMDGNGPPPHSWAKGYTSCCCSPELAPDRAVGYSGLDVLVLGKGCERLSQPQWNAIREWVLTGGSLVMLGDPQNTAYLATPTGSEFCPLSEPHSGDSVSFTFASSSNRPKKYNNIAIIDGKPKPGAFVVASQKGNAILVGRRYGMGAVTLSTFDPLLQSVGPSRGGNVFLSSIMAKSMGGLSSSSLSNWARGQAEKLLPPSQFAQNNPFQIKLPSLLVVGSIFAVYFILCVPLTFFVLRRVGKPEWAWISTPILSVLFAFIFYLFNINLYKAALTTRSAGIIAASEGQPGAVLSAASEVFIPTGGAYDFAIPQAQSLEENTSSDDYESISGARPLETSNTSSGIGVTGMQVSNLSFRRFFYTAPVDLGGSVTTSIEASGTKLTGTITNHTSQVFNDLKLVYVTSNQSFSLGTLQPGQTRTFSTGKPELVPDVLSGWLSQTEKNGSDKQSAYLIAALPANALGLQMGRNISNPNSFKLVMSVPVKVRGVR